MKVKVIYFHSVVFLLTKQTYTVDHKMLHLQLWYYFLLQRRTERVVDNASSHTIYRRKFRLTMFAFPNKSALVARTPVSHLEQKEEFHQV